MEEEPKKPTEPAAKKTIPTTIPPSPSPPSPTVTDLDEDEDADKKPSPKPSSLGISPKVPKRSFDPATKQAVMDYLSGKSPAKPTVNYELEQTEELIKVKVSTDDKATLFLIQPDQIVATAKAKLTAENIQDMLEAALKLFPGQQLSITVPEKDNAAYQAALNKLPEDSKARFERSNPEPKGSAHLTSAEKDKTKPPPLPPFIKKH